MLLDLTAAAIAFIPSVFGFVMQAVMEWGLDLSGLIPILTAPPRYDPTNKNENGINRLIFETCRLNPPAKILMRTSVRNDVLPSGGSVKKGDFIATMIAAAGLDDYAFPGAESFSLYPFLSGQPRDIDNYLLFGVSTSGGGCAGAATGSRF